MKYVDNEEFKKLTKLNKTTKVPLRKISSGMPTVVGDRQIKFIFSSATVDRDFDLITQEGIDLTWYQTNPLIFYSHDHDSVPIGKCVSIGIENGSLTGIIEFVPENNPAVGTKAEGIFQLCKDGFLSAVSIGFIPLTYEHPDDELRYRNDGLDILSCELVEVSVCGIPSNRSALIQEISGPTPVMAVSEMEPQPKKYRAARLNRVIEALS